jgi:all-trans-retinol 13,14-reductase
MTRKVFLQHFPHLEAKALDKYYRRCYWARQVAFVVFFFKMLPPFVTRLCWPSMTSLYHKTCLPTTISVMNECGLPPDVIGALLYCWGDYGTPPGESPFFMQAFMESHYDGGAYFPKGGSSSIAKTLVAAILRRGGQVFANSPVERILVQKNWFGKAYQAVGVRGE